MAKNDTILLDGIIDKRQADGLPSSRRDEVFEFFGFEQVLKDYDLSREELESGWVDGKDDGGIDGFFTLVNGHLLQDTTTFAWPRRSAEIEIWVITCKHHETFQQQPLNALYATVAELFDLSVECKELQGTYSEELRHARDLLHFAYRRLSAVQVSIKINFAYVSRGDTGSVAENVQARANQIVEAAKSLFSASTSSFSFIGAAELVRLYRASKRFSIDLPVLEMLSHGQSGYVVLTDLEAYAKFVTDESNHLRRYLFDSNVRDFLGTSTVNLDIRSSLQDPKAPDFWWLNNGVTMLVTAARVVGKVMHLEDIQIVNGLQTTETIYRHFQEEAGTLRRRALLVKIIVSAEAEHRDRIIQATNNQNTVEVSGLRATDKVQRDIEDYLDRHDWYYERRKNYYRNIGKSPKRFVTPMYLASGCVCLVMKNPRAAVRLKARFMRSDVAYGEVFDEQVPLTVWLRITEVLKRVDEGLERLRPVGNSDRFLAFYRYLVGFIEVARVLGTFDYALHEFVAMNPEQIAEDRIVATWGLIQNEMQGEYQLKLARKGGFVLACCKRAADTYLIKGIEVVGRRQLVPVGKSKSNRLRVPKDWSKEITPEFLNEVDAILPPQPWKPGMHRAITTQLNCPRGKLFAAIAELIETGRRNRQKDGTVYDRSGNVIATDQQRVTDVNNGFVEGTGIA